VRPADPVDAARRLADDLLAPAAQTTDRAACVPRPHLDALAGAGLYGLLCPPAASPAVVREVFEVLAGACGVTFFVWVQHHGAVRQLAVSGNVSRRERALAGLCDGRVRGGVAFSHLRRPGPPAIVATAVPGGYRVDGEAPWVTSWGMADLFTVAARLGDHIVWFLLDSRRRDPAVRPSAPLALAAMNASATVRLGLEGLVVPDDDVLAVAPFEQWLEADRIGTAQPNPASLGIAATCIRLLADRAPDTAIRLGDELAECRSRAYGLADEDLTHPAHIAAMVEARAWGLALAIRAAGALITAVGGRALTLDHPAQRLLREAAFFSIQAQTPALRRAVLAQLERS